VSAALFACRLVLAVVFLVAGMAKLADREGSRSALVGFGIAEWLARPMAVLLPLVELVVAGALLPENTAWWSAAGALVLLAAFMVAISVSLARGRTPDCHCFGQIHSAPAGLSTLGRNGVLAAAAAVVVAQGPDGAGPSAVSGLSALNAGAWAALAAGVVTLALAVGGWLILALLRQHGRLLLRVEALEARLRQVGLTDAAAELPFVGLPVGARAPAFDLPELSGSSVSLDQLLARGRPVLLLFSEPQCRPCAELLPLVSRWQDADRERLSVVVISQGEPTANGELTSLGIRDVLLQAEREVAAAYEVPGTPGAVLIEPGGGIASAVALGSDAIHRLVSRALSGQAQGTPLQGSNGDAQDPGSSVELARPSELSPALQLPDLTGAVFELSDLRGSETLLLFWDPACEFCRQILEDVRTLERANHPLGPRKLMLVSTGSIEANRAMGLHSLILLDDSAEVARAFGAHGTPSAVLLDKEARPASRVVFGGEAVLQLGGFSATAASSA
jgi:methylamine dehydrogenase accessory protein MauD